MSLDVLDQPRPGATHAARGLMAALVTFPRNYPVGWAIAWTVLLLGLCLAPARAIPGEDTLTVKKFLPHSDLAVHFTLFAGFVVSWLRVGGTPVRWVLVPALGLLLAVATECAQGLPFIQRDPDLLDALADGVGVVVALVGSAIRLRPSAFQHVMEDKT